MRHQRLTYTFLSSLPTRHFPSFPLTTSETRRKAQHGGSRYVIIQHRIFYHSMPTLLERELQRLAHVDLGDPNKTQVFETKLCVSRTRGRQAIYVERDESEPDEESEITEDVHVVETASNDSQLENNPLDNEEALIKFFLVLKALLAPCISHASPH